jgi:hypothetical protein
MLSRREILIAQLSSAGLSQSKLTEILRQIPVLFRELGLDPPTTSEVISLDVELKAHRTDVAFKVYRSLQKKSYPPPADLLPELSFTGYPTYPKGLILVTGKISSYEQAQLSTFLEQIKQDLGENSPLFICLPSGSSLESLSEDEKLGFYSLLIQQDREEVQRLLGYSS